LGCGKRKIRVTAFFCRRSKGPVKLQWQAAPGKQQSAQVVLLQPTRFTLPKE